VRYAPIGTITMRAVRAAETLAREPSESRTGRQLMIFAGAGVAAELRGSLPGHSFWPRAHAPGQRDGSTPRV